MHEPRRESENASSQSKELEAFAKRLTLLLMFRAAVGYIAAWLFLWGLVALTVKVAGFHGDRWLPFGVLGFIPVALIVAGREWLRRPAFVKVRAAFDSLANYGGVLMAEEAGDMKAWQTQVDSSGSPRLRWRNGRSFSYLMVATLFVSIACWLPDRFASAYSSHPLEIGNLVGELHTEIEALKDEKILEEKKAEDLQKQLQKLNEEASGRDPDKTWEALDHMKDADSQLAKQAAEEAISKRTTLNQAEALASALQQASEMGLDEDTSTRASQDLAGLLKSAKLEEGLLKGNIPSELLSQLNGLSKEDMAKLLSAIQANKNSLGQTVSNLAKLKMIDPKMLGQCNKAGQCPNPSALAAFLSESGSNCNSFSEAAMAYCENGGGAPVHGPGDAPMTWKDETAEEGAKFKEKVLPPSAQLSQSEFVGVSKGAPELSGETVTSEHGALAQAASSGGAAHAQTILPRHRQTVQRYFKR